MKLDFDFDPKTHTAHITYFLSELTGDHNIQLALNLLSCIAGDYDLDPELEPEEFLEIIQKVKTAGQTDFTIDIDEDGIEIDL
jgi:hypothetical protein